MNTSNTNKKQGALRVPASVVQSIESIHRILVLGRIQGFSMPNPRRAEGARISRPFEGSALLKQETTCRMNKALDFLSHHGTECKLQEVRDANQVRETRPQNGLQNANIKCTTKKDPKCEKRMKRSPFEPTTILLNAIDKQREYFGISRGVWVRGIVITWLNQIHLAGQTRRR